MTTRLRAVASDLFAWFLGPVVFISRWLTMSRPYFADGPALIRAARDHVYVIQPPGYWLYGRAAALFPDPAFGLSLVNALASAAGAVVFYALALQLTTRSAARLAVVAYSCIYFAWFAASVQSSYAGELLFSPLLLFLMVLYIERPHALLLVGIAVVYALAAGIRPSDGVFLAPALAYFTGRYVVSWRLRTFLITAAAVFCLLWFIPEQLALSKFKATAAHQLWSVAGDRAPILHGFSKLAISNMVRVASPLALALWSLAFAIFGAGENRIRTLLWLWIIPGLIFFTAVYISEAPYLCFLLPAFLLLPLT
ncbi:MAG: glycosyltransferase family 39 protein, partial [Acidobacteriaceae bacterium]|nr:glycosyltransferase family 39 protein [Acidobacteriaceae bacterium]